MTKPKLNNSLYDHLLSAVNQALPLEYAIRAAEQDNPVEMAKLKEINHLIRELWHSLGLTDDEIEWEKLLDLTWDTIQVGFPMTRRHDRVYLERNHLRLIEHGISLAQSNFSEDIESLKIPASQYFRICDLISGNNILGMMRTVANCLANSRVVERNIDLLRKMTLMADNKVPPELENIKNSGSELDHVAIEKYLLGIRTPIHIHPAMSYVAKYRHKGNAQIEQFGFVLDTDTDISMPEIHKQIREFLYQFAIRKMAFTGNNAINDTSKEIIQAFLMDELLGKISPNKISRMDGLIGPLAGLYCWDLARHYERGQCKSSVETALDQATEDYPKGVRSVDLEAMRKNYRLATNAIRNVPFERPTERKRSRTSKPKSS